jgi:hypothetical protein
MEDVGLWWEVQNSMTNSRYMATIDTQKSYDLGCKLGTQDAAAPGTQDNIVILDYGAATFQDGQYGAKYPGTQIFVTLSQIEAAVKQFGFGYRICTGSDLTSTTRVAVGTNNNGNAVNFAHGQAWAQMTNSIGAWFAANASQAQVAGANDIEVDFGPPSQAYDWLSGYDSVNTYFMYNFGDAAACPESGTTSTPAACITQLNLGWDQEEIYHVSYGSPPAQAIPEIYNVTGANARQWQQIKLYAYLRYGRMFEISGVLTQHEACLSRPPADTCHGNTDNKPQNGYTQLLNEMNSDSRTQQGTLRWLTDITWNSDPNVNP